MIPEAASNETGPYCEWDGSSTLTFKYGTYTPSTIQMAVDINSGYTGQPEWCTRYASRAKTISIDPSFSNLHPTSLERWFTDFDNVDSVQGLENLKTDQVTSFQSTFGGMLLLHSIDVSSFVIGQGVDMNGMFDNTPLDSLDSLASWDVSGVTDFGAFFDQARAASAGYISNLTSLDALSSWDVSSQASMRRMFLQCPNLTSISGIKDWKVGSSANTQGMFMGCPKLTCIGGAQSATQGFVPKADMFEPGGPSGNWYPEASATTSPVTGADLIANWPSYAQTSSVWAKGDGGYPFHSVTFNSQGGSDVDSITVAENTSFQAPVPPTRTGYQLEGWYTQPTGGTAWDFATDLMPTQDLTLYAHWTENPGPTPGPTPTPTPTPSPEDNILPKTGDMLSDTSSTVAMLSTLAAVVLMTAAGTTIALRIRKKADR